MEIQKMSKGDLLREIKRIEKRIEEVKDEKILYRYRQRRKLVRRHFYECRLCADALTETYIGSDGDEKERYVQDCGLEVCPYHDYFVDLANGVEDDVTKSLKIFLSRF